jgi:hypothetical protein
MSKEGLEVAGSYRWPWGGDEEKGDKPRAVNIQAVCEELRKRGFSRIITIVDASLRHEIDDPSMYEVLRRDQQVMEAPAGTDADEFILQYVAKHDAYVVSNDRYTEWKEKDLWLKGNLENRCLPFVIVDDEVFLRKMEQA